MRLTSSEFNVRLTPEAVLLVSPPSHSTVIHHKRASRYVVLGEILLSPFTTYIFIGPPCRIVIEKTAPRRIGEEPTQTGADSLYHVLGKRHSVF